MLVTTLDAKARLEAEGLHVACNNAHSLWIAAHVQDTGEGIRLSNDACGLLWDSDRWVAVFPAQGLLTYEIPGTLPDLVSLISAIYSQYRCAGGEFRDAFMRVVPDPEQYLVGRSLSRV
jgi:hypothetical protein